MSSRPAYDGRRTDYSTRRHIVEVSSPSHSGFRSTSDDDGRWRGNARTSSRELLNAASPRSRYQRKSPSEAIARYVAEHPDELNRGPPEDDDDEDQNTEPTYTGGRYNGGGSNSSSSYQRGRYTNQPTSNGWNSGIDPDVPRSAGDQREYMLRVQRELAQQRDTWKTEVDRLTRGASALQIGDDDTDGRSRNGRTSAADRFGTSDGRDVDHPSGFSAETNSYVDTSSGRPIFRAFVDVSEYSPRDVHVSIDKRTNRVVVEASTGDEAAEYRTFTQRIQMPQFADEANISAKMNQRGILKVEIPLIYYFQPSKREIERDSQAKAFVYEIRDDPADPSRQLMEILVNTGSDVTARDVRVEIGGDGQLIVFADVASPYTASGFDRKVIKRYALPPRADAQHITSKLGRDGRLTILIPIYK